MNRITRQVAVILGAALASIATASVLLYLEARGGGPLFGYMEWSYVPLGAIAAGLVSALGVLGCALLLRARPAPALLVGLLAVSAGTVFLVQSAEVAIGSARGIAANDPAWFAAYVVNTAAHTPRALHARAGSAAPAGVSVAPDVAGAIPAGGAAENDAQVQSISNGVQGVVASQDMGSNAAVSGTQRVAEIGDDIQSIQTNVQHHGGEWLLMALEAAGFSLGGVLVYWFLRSRPYCEDCHLLLNRKGAQTRYFEREEEINGSVEDVLRQAKCRRLQLSIQAHGARGLAEKSKRAEFASSIQVSLCMRCHSHRMDFRAMRKDGAGWKQIPVLGYSACSYEPLELAR